MWVLYKRVFLRPCRTRQHLLATWTQPIAVHATGPPWYGSSCVIFFHCFWSTRKIGKHWNVNDFSTGDCFQLFACKLSRETRYSSQIADPQSRLFLIIVLILLFRSTQGFGRHIYRISIHASRYLELPCCLVSLTLVNISFTLCFDLVLWAVIGEYTITAMEKAPVNLQGFCVLWTARDLLFTIMLNHHFKGIWHWSVCVFASSINPFRVHQNVLRDRWTCGQTTVHGKLGWRISLGKVWRRRLAEEDQRCVSLSQPHSQFKLTSSWKYSWLYHFVFKDLELSAVFFTLNVNHITSYNVKFTAWVKTSNFLF